MILICLILLLMGCDPYPGAMAPTQEQRSAIDAVVASGTWGPCAEYTSDYRVLVTGRIEDYCGGLVNACHDSDVIILNSVWKDTKSELTLTAHEAIHCLSGCYLGTADPSHSRYDLWIKPDTCLIMSVEGRARVLMGLDGCENNNIEACRCVNELY